MTLSDSRVQKLLDQYFVSGWTNIKGKRRYAGSSNTHRPTDPAKQVNNCSGHHNIQMFFLTADGRVLHCLPGYWSPEHFLHEAKLAVELGKVYYAKELSVVARNDKFLDLHLIHALEHPADLRRASRLQGFDLKHVKEKTKDFNRSDGFVAAGLKLPDQVIHERMAGQAFVPFEKFDVESYINLGIKRYKYDFGLEKSAGKGHACKCGKTCGCSSCGCAKKR